MKRRLFGSVLAVLAVLLGILYWLLGTPSGALWLMKASSHAGILIEAQRIDGRLCGDLRVHGLRVVWASGMLQSKKLSLRWRPVSLLSGRISVKRLELDQVTVDDRSQGQKGPVDLSWPHVSGLAAIFDAGVDLLSINRLIYRRLSEPARELTSLEASIDWHEGTLGVSILHVAAGPFQAKGLMTVGLARPSLSLVAAAALSTPAGGIDRLTLHAVLSEGKEKDEQVAGQITFSAMSGKSQIFSLVSDVSVMKKSVGIKDLVIVSEGRRGAVRGRGKIDFPGGEPRIAVAAKIYDLDLLPEARFFSHVSGSVDIEAETDSYRGTFDLANFDISWRKVRLAGSFEGNDESAQLSRLEGNLLDGVIEGKLGLGWRNGFSVDGSLIARDLNPAVVSPEWHGSVNFDAEAMLTGKESGMAGTFSVRLLDSRLRGTALRGEMLARLAEGDLVFARLGVQGGGFSVRAEGDLTKKLSFVLKASDLSTLAVDAKGGISAEGWMRLRKRRPEGSISVAGRAIALHRLQIGSFKTSGRLKSSEGYPLELKADMRDVSYGGIGAESVKLSAEGTEGRHAIVLTVRTGKHFLTTALEGGYSGGIWQGRIGEFTGRDESGTFRMPEPSLLKISSKSFFLSPVVIVGEGGERATLSGKMDLNPLNGMVRAEWEQLNLLRTAWIAPNIHLSGRSTGRIRAETGDGRLLKLAAEMSASGEMVLGRKSVGFHGATGKVKWGGDGVKASVEVDISGGGRISGNLVAEAPAALSLPPGGTIDLAWSGVDMAFFKPWISPDIHLGGSLVGKMDGKWEKEGPVQMHFEASVSNGGLRFEKEWRTMKAEIRSATLDADWRGEGLKGRFVLELADYGRASGGFAIPLPARLPVKIDPKGPVTFSFQGRARENGLLTSLFPGLAQESSGEVELSLDAKGQWESPVLTAKMRIEKAGAYFPPTGIYIKNARLSASVSGNTVKVESFHAESGQGSVDGEAIIRLRGWSVEEYRGNIKGDRFQTFHLPELTLLASPDLSFEGTTKKLAVNGEVRVPEMLVTGGSKEVVRQSPDVVLTGPTAEESAGPQLVMDINVTAVLGDRVFVKAQGFDAQLKGSVKVAATQMKDIRGRGQIEIVKGRYSAYGVNLSIERGKVLFSGGPADNPTLDVLALRKAGDVKAGVLVTGTLRSLQVRLYSEPSMTDTDILAYIVLGHQLGNGGQEEASLMVQAAGQLLSAGESVVLQDRIERTIGLDTLDVETGGGNVSRSLVTVGKYLTPKLYVSYGRSLFGSGGIFTAKYSLTKKWEVDVSSGEESAGDIFYKIEFR